jgi:hypothetical protein
MVVKSDTPADMRAVLEQYEEKFRNNPDEKVGSDVILVLLDAVKKLLFPPGTVSKIGDQFTG